METLGIDSTPEELDRMFNEVDLDGSGEIDFDEFMTVMSIKIASTNTPDDIKNAFKVFEGKLCEFSTSSVISKYRRFLRVELEY